MTTYNKTTLKTFFENGDIPTQQNYSDFIDSYVNIVETASQSMAGPLVPTELVTPRVSAANANFTAVLSANSLVLNSSLSGITADFTGALTANSLNIATDVSAANGTVYASAMRSQNGLFSGVGIVSAAGTAQATAAVLTNVINRGKGIVDGTTTGFTPLANRAGLIQYLFNEGASANLWPPVGGTINGLAVNAPFSLAASAAFTIMHLTASAMAVK